MADLRRQWDLGRRFLRRRYRRVDGFIAYFQAFSNTHAALPQLQALYDPLPAAWPECVGLAIGTRPDCLPPATIDYLAEVAQRLPLSVEVGLQSDRNSVLASMNRGHDRACFEQAIGRLDAANIESGAHVILGLPGEGADAPERLGRYPAALPITTVKVHNLHFVRGTHWGRAWQEGQMVAMGRQEYVASVARFLAELRPDQAVQRVLGDAPDKLLLTGSWCRRKQDFLTHLAGGIAQHQGQAITDETGVPELLLNSSD